MSHPVGQEDSSLPSFLTGGGIAGALVQSVDWTKTPLGPIADWPESLTTIVGTILHSRHPMFLWWGPDLIQFYNDAYLPSFGKGKHPAAMGQRGFDCWQEIWPIIGPQIDEVMQGRTASWHEDQLVPIFRNGRIEEVYWTYGYSPVFDKSGGVGGTLVVCTETTRRIISGRRSALLRSFIERTFSASDGRAVIECAADAFGRGPADVPFAVLYEAHAPSQTPALVRSVGLSPEDCAFIDLRFRGRLHPLSERLHAESLPRVVASHDNPWPEPVNQICVSAVTPADQTVPSAYIIFGLSPRLPFDETYRNFVRQLTEEIAHAQKRIESLRLRTVMETERNNLLEQAPVATALWVGPEHEFRLANPRFQRLVGRNDMIGKTYREVFPELRETPLPGILDQVYRTGEPFVTDEMMVRLDRTGDGTVEDGFFQFNVEAMRNASGDVYGMMAVVVDITPQVTARRAIEQSRESREVLMRELQTAGRAKDEFLAMLGHELRNPLASILTALQLMRLREVQGGEKERAVIERQVHHMIGLVNDLLDVSRIARGDIPLNLKALRVADVIAKGVELASALIEQRAHRLTVEIADDLMVDGDAGRLAQVVANVLTNAAKYTDPHGQIDVRATRRHSEVEISVRDNGIGIDPAMLTQMFEPFTQERHDRVRSQGGLGLGLAIVRRLVHAHRGSVALKSEGRGRGTEFDIRLPLSTPDTEGG